MKTHRPAGVLLTAGFLLLLEEVRILSAAFQSRVRTSPAQGVPLDARASAATPSVAGEDPTRLSQQSRSPGASGVNHAQPGWGLTPAFDR